MKRRTFLLGGCAAAASGLMPLTGFFDLKAYATDRYRYQISDEIFKDRFAPLDPARLVVNDEAEAARFLNLATFGPTPSDLTELVNYGSVETWFDAQRDAFATTNPNDPNAEWFIDEDGDFQPRAGWIGRCWDLMRMPRAYIPESDFSYGQEHRTQALLTAYLHDDHSQQGLYGTNIKAPNKELAMKMSYLLGRLIPVQSPSRIGWFTVLGRHSLGNYKELLVKIAYDYRMSEMLTYYANTREGIGGGVPDQNAGREWIQLFGPGLFLLDDGGRFVFDANGQRIETYAREDVEQAARCFTGFVLDRHNAQPDSNELYELDANIPANSFYRDFGNNDRSRAVRDSLDRAYSEHTFGPLDNRGTGPFLREFRFGVRKPLSTIKKGKWYRIFSNTEATADLTALGATNTANGQQFKATADGEPGMTQGLVQERRNAYRGIGSELTHVEDWYERGSKVCPSLGINVPAGLDPETSLEVFVDQLVDHPNTARYVCMRLIMMATTGNPSPAYVKRVVNVFRQYKDDKLQLWHVAKAIFTDPTVLTDNYPVTFGRQRDSFEVVANAIRSLEMTSISSESYVAPSSGAASGRPSFNLYIGDEATSGGQTNPIGPLSESQTFAPRNGPPGPRRKVAGTTVGFIRAPRTQAGNDWLGKPGLGFTGIIEPWSPPSIFGWTVPFGTQFPASENGLTFSEGSLYNAETRNRLLSFLEILAAQGDEFYKSGGEDFTAIGTFNSGGTFTTIRPVGGVSWDGASPTRVNPSGDSVQPSFTHLAPRDYAILGDLNDPAQFVQRLNLLLCRAKLTTQQRQEIVDLLNTMPASTAIERSRRVSQALVCIFQSPEFFLN